MPEDEINELKRLFYSDRLTKYGKRKLIEHYEKQIKELKEENAMFKKVNKITKNITTEEIENAIKEANKKYIPVSLVEEKRTKLKEQYNKVVNEINNQGMIEQLIDFKEVSAKLEMCEELLEKRK